MKTNIVTFLILLLVFMGFSSAFVLKNNVTKNPNEKTFQELIALFPKDNGLTFELGTSFYQKSKKGQRAYFPKKYRDNLTHEYNQYLPYITDTRQMSRIPAYYFPIQLIETEDFVTFIYCKSNGFSSRAFDKLYVSVLTKEGNSVHHENLSEGLNPKDVITFKIDENLKLEKTIHLRQCADNIYDNNQYALSQRKQTTIDLKTMKQAEKP